MSLLLSMSSNCKFLFQNHYENLPQDNCCFEVYLFYYNFNSYQQYLKYIVKIVKLN